MAFWFITASIFRHSIITFSLKRSKRGMASILIGSRSIPFLGNRRYNAIRWSEQAFDLCRGVYFELRLWNSWPGIWLHELLQLNQQTSSQNTQRWYLEAGENKHGSLKFHRKINLNIMAKTEQNLSYLLLRWVYIRFKYRKLINFFF